MRVIFRSVFTPLGTERTPNTDRKTDQAEETFQASTRSSQAHQLPAAATTLATRKPHFAEPIDSPPTATATGRPSTTGNEFQ